MNHNDFFDAGKETLGRAGLESYQQTRLQEMLNVVLRENPFYRKKLVVAGQTPTAGDLQELPFTMKSELLADAADHPPYGSNLTFSPEKYVRLHQTSGTKGRPLVVLDTAESWSAWKRCWAVIYRAAGLVPGDRIYVAFSFGLFAGFWAAYESAPDLGYRVIAGGGQSSVQRLHTIFEHEATVLLCTPSYALHLAEVAREERVNLASGPVRITLHAGEAGASIPATKSRIEESWGARCFDHIGASEVGPYGFECQAQPGGVHVNEMDYICEVIDPDTLQLKAPGEVGELVLTNLNRWGFPVIRYRTGDLVKLSEDEVCACGRTFRLLMGGIQARTDDMMTIRGVNVYPTALETVLRRFTEVAEFAGEVSKHSGMDELKLKVELEPAAEPLRLKAEIENELRQRLGLRIDVEMVLPGTLPRYELKARRFTRI